MKIVFTDQKNPYVVYEKEGSLILLAVCAQWIPEAVTLNDDEAHAFRANPQSVIELAKDLCRHREKYRTRLEPQAVVDELLRS